MRFRHVAMLLLVSGLVASASLAAGPKKLLLLGQGPDGHPPTTHEYLAGSRILAKCLEDVRGLEVKIVRADEPWTEGPDLIDQADGVVIFLSEGAKWASRDAKRLAALQRLAKRGGALVGLHWGVGTRDAKNIEAYVNLVGACHGGPDRKHKVVEADLRVVDKRHPITRGIEDLHVREELYYRLKTAKPAERVRPILKAKIDGRDEMVSWAWERPDGGRSFGFTGLHFHKHWAHEAYRRLAAQGVLWSLKLPVPADGLAVRVSEADLRLK